MNRKLLVLVVFLLFIGAAYYWYLEKNSMYMTLPVILGLILIYLLLKKQIKTFKENKK